MRVAWVHPTWRDLVIERVSDDATLRRHFLSRCGVHGMVLALSVAGGSGGQRQLPLIGCDDDWDTLGDRLYALVPQLETTELVALLEALTATIAALEPAGAGSEAQVLAAMLLRRTSARWDAARVAIPLPALDAWLGLSRQLRPPLDPPSLGATWVELLPVQAPDPDDLPEVQRFTEWLILCLLLADFAGEHLLSLGYCSEQIALIVQFIDRVAADPQAGASEAATRALEAAALLCPELSSRAHRLLRGWDPSVTWIREPPPPDAPAFPEGLDIDRVLADL
ncbi:MAG TPA: hypothetical protein VG365_15320 [Solirubrobacteraceae bacterium]|jgi:hypothetical protein|nr:hypothetical protein [Solirubrobacteraceae bacterium]